MTAPVSPDVDLAPGFAAYLTQREQMILRRRDALAADVHQGLAVLAVDHPAVVEVRCPGAVLLTAAVMGA